MARFTRADGTRSNWLPLDPRIKPDARDEAERCAATLAAQVTARTTAAAGVETCDGWHARYLAYCTERGLCTVGDKGYRWRKWISPTIGGKPPAGVTREDVEAIRNDLDTAIRDGRVKWKTAANVWGELSASLSEMCSSKRKDLQAITADPSTGVRAPETGGATSKVYPYPSEFLQIVTCEDVPLEWREIHTIAAYTYLRPGELWVLEWPDVDLADERIHVTKAWDFKNRQTKATKTDETRTIPIEPNLLPLLRRMHELAGGKGLVVPALSKVNPDTIAKLTLRHFEQAGCKRARLYKSTGAERHVVFRSWRDAGCTWSIVRGDGIERVQRRAGHKLISTTQRYVIEAENRGATFGTPFPPLPADLIGGISSSKRQMTEKVPKTSRDMCERRELNPPSQSHENIVIPITYKMSSEAHSVIETASGFPSRPGEMDAKTLLERAIERLTRAMGSVDDGDVADLVRERASMRAELEGLTRGQNVVPIRPRR
jgi:hypothetical protein